MEKIISPGFIIKYAKHCRKFMNEQTCVMDALRGEYPRNIKLPSPEVNDIIGKYGEDTQQDTVYLVAESWTLDVYGHKMTEPFMFSYRLQDDNIVFDE